MKTLYTPYNYTVSAFSSGPPSSPSTGDIWVGTGVDTLGTRWQFQYNAGSASTYKWEFIGGLPAWTHYDYPGGLSIGLSTYTPITNCSFTIIRAGDYIFTGEAEVNGGTTGSPELIVALSQNSTTGPVTGGWGTAYFGFPTFTNSASNPTMKIMGSYRFDGAAVNDIFRLLAWSNGATSNTVAFGRFSMIPARII